jgi:hypothetical protein
MTVDRRVDKRDRDDALVCHDVASAPPDSNIVYIVDGCRSVVDDIRSGELVEDGLFDLLDAIGSEECLTSAVLRCLATGRLRAHREFDPADEPLHIVVITAAPQSVN